MTLFKPTISLRRLTVYKDNHVVFDSSFHNGVNIIRGHNSSGKTTVLDFIAYTLGAEYIPWKQEALLCDWSCAEVSLNGKLVTFRREVNQKLMNPLYIFWGNFEEALKAAVTAWEVFGFRRSSSKISFTQAILLALDLPEAQGDGASNLTMHQFLRVLYADQPSLHNPIFRNDAYDNALTRETVGSYLSGVYNDKLYAFQLERREQEKVLVQLEAELRSIFAVLAKSGRGVNLEFLGVEIQTLEAKRESQLAELSRLRRERTVSAETKKETGNENIRLQLDNAKHSFFNAQDTLTRYELEIADSRKFVDELEYRLTALDESSSARSYFGRLSFAFCPCCLAEIKPTEKDSNQCGLCKSQIVESAPDSQILRMRNELRIQLTESLALVDQKEAEARDLRNRLPLLRKELKVLERKYTEASQSWSSDLETAIESIAHQLGAIDQEIKSLYEHQRLAEVIRERQARREEIAARILTIDSSIESLVYAQENLKQKVQLEIASTLGRLLREDLHRQEHFRTAENIQFSFTDNEVSVEGATQFSESSTVVLRHLFHLSLLSASTRVPEMRFPRFLLLDGIEDGGMELERSHRLQEIIVKECSKFECEYQLIFATSQIAPSLDVKDFVVARSFTEESRSLDIRSGSQPLLSPQAGERT